MRDFIRIGAVFFLMQALVAAGEVVPPRPVSGKADHKADNKTTHRVDRKLDVKRRGVVRKAYRKNDVAGAWDSDWGWMVLKTTQVRGKKTLSVSGWWVQDVSKKGLIPSGTYDPASRTFRCDLVQDWNSVKGTARFRLSADGWALTGSWKHSGGQGEWKLKRVVGDDFQSQVDSLVEDAGVSRDTPGCAVLVIEDGKVVLQKGYGLACLRDKTPITSQTSFELASCSKQFAAAAIMRLCDQGKLSFADDVRKYVPELPRYRKGTIRLHHLLHHTSGLPQYGDFEVPKVAAGRKPPYVCNEDFAGEFARQRKKFPLKFAPGEKYEYNNGGYMLLALVAQRVAHKPFGRVLQDEVFVPLGMRHSWVYDSPRARPRSPALGYGLSAAKKLEEVYGCPPYRKEFWLCVGGSGVWTCVEDLARWDAAWRSGKFFKPATAEAACRPWKTRDGQAQGYGFGWGLGHDGDGLTWMAHSGGGPSFCSTVYRNLAEDRTIAVLTNYHECELYWVRDGLERLCRARKAAGADR
jgi:CubicO group peptidase (beta-lactamase class C family)